jgi:hypothetical protein
MATIWVVALLAAGIAIAGAGGEPLRRVATAFLVGEALSTFLLAGFAVTTHTSGVQPASSTRLTQEG